MNEALYNTVGQDRIESRQVDEMIGIARGIMADGRLNQEEVEFLQKWLAASIAVRPHPLIRILYQRVAGMLSDGVLDEDEQKDLFDTLHAFVNQDIELGEDLKPTDLPLCVPPPTLSFTDRLYCFTGTFTYGQRKHCEDAVRQRGGQCGGLRKATNVLVIGSYVSGAWKHSSFGNKILQAVDWRDAGAPISIVSEAHWRRHL